MNEQTRTRRPINVERLVNQLRKERNLPTVVSVHSKKITRSVLRQVALEVWRKYPQSLTDPDYQLGELTLDLVNQEIRQRIADLRRGVVVGKASLKDYFN